MPRTVKTALSDTADIIELLNAVFMRENRFAPKSWDTTIDEPIFEPAAIAINIIVTGYDAPTAARASTPINFLRQGYPPYCTYAERQRLKALPWKFFIGFCKASRLSYQLSENLLSVKKELHILITAPFCI